MKFTSALVAAVLTASIGGIAIAQGERDYDLPSFDRVDLSAGVMLIADIGGPQSITVTTDGGDFSDFKINVKNGELNVSRKWNKLSWHSKKAKYKVIVTAPSLEGVEASSGSHAKISNVDSEKFYVDLSSGAHVSVEGRCDDCNLDSSSGASLRGKMLTCDNANIDVSSGGRIEVNVVSSLLADASSGGTAYVYGDPNQRNIDRSSGGRVKLVTYAQAKR